MNQREEDRFSENLLLISIGIFLGFLYWAFNPYPEVYDARSNTFYVNLD